MDPTVTRNGLFGCQVCVPVDWSDEETCSWVETNNPCGTSGGWFLAKDGAESLIGDDSRVACATREGFVHRRFDC